MSAGWLYIAGPMRGRPDHNFPAFDAAEARFRALGWRVVSPVNIGRNVFGNDPNVPGSEYLRADVRELLRCDAIAVLPEWDHSTGARCEVAVAVTIGLAFYDAETGEAIPAPERVVIAGGYDKPAGRVDTLDGLAGEVCAWQDVTFPHATPVTVAEHLRREVAELCAEPSDPEEIADCFLLVVGAANKSGVSLLDVGRAKLEKCKRRTWGKPDAAGVVEHVRDDGAALAATEGEHP